MDYVRASRSIDHRLCSTLSAFAAAPGSAGLGAAVLLSPGAAGRAELPLGREGFRGVSLIGESYARTCNCCRVCKVARGKLRMPSDSGVPSAAALSLKPWTFIGALSLQPWACSSSPQGLSRAYLLSVLEHFVERV